MVDVANQIEVLEHKAVTLKRQVSHHKNKLQAGARTQSNPWILFSKCDCN